MPQRKCCVKNCNRPHEENTILHKFPNPKYDLLRFNKWTRAIGGNLLVLDMDTVYDNYRVCHGHFDAKYHTWSKRAKVWAKFCWPHFDWSSDQSLYRLYKQNKVLCANHFDNSAYTTSEKHRLNKFAIPYEARNILTQVREEMGNLPMTLQDTQVPNSHISDNITEIKEKNQACQEMNANTEIREKGTAATTSDATESQTKTDTVQSAARALIPPTPPPPDDPLLVDQERATEIVIANDDDDDDQEITEKTNAEHDITDDNDVVEYLQSEFLDDDFDAASDGDEDYVPDGDDNDGQTGDDLPVPPGRSTELSIFKPSSSRSPFKVTNHTLVNVTRPQTVKTESQAVFKLPQILPAKGTRIIVSNKTSKDAEQKQLGVCRCCLKRGYHSVVNIFEQLECLNLQPCVDARVSRLLCAECAEFVRRARRFRDTAAAAERTLLQLLPESPVNMETGDVGNSSSTVKIEFVSKTGEVKDIKIPISSINQSREQILEGGAKKRRILVLNKNIILKSVSDNTTLQLDDDIPDETEGNQSMIKTEDDVESEMGVPMEDPESETAADDDYRSALHRPFSQFSDYTDVDPKENNEFLSDKEILNMLWTMKKEQADMAAHIRENLITLLENSTLLPFASPKGIQFDCIYCDGTFKRIDDLRQHMEESHVKEDTLSKQNIIKIIPQSVIRADISCIKCRLCDERLENIDDLATHLVQIHDKKYHELSLDPPHNIICFDMTLDTWKCLTCENEFPDFKKLQAHVNKHFGMFLCHLCGSKFLFPNAYSKHMQDHRKVKVEIKHICDKCGEEFKTKRELSFHAKVHYDHTLTAKGEKRKYNIQQLLPDDDNVGEKQIFDCMLCEKGITFTSRNAAYMHRIGHLNNTREGPFMCEQCPYTTSKKIYLRNHLRKHYKVAFFMCEECSKKFTTKEKLSDHMMKDHLNIRFQCPLCDTTLSNKKHVVRHVNNKHPGVKVDFSN